MINLSLAACRIRRVANSFPVEITSYVTVKPAITLYPAWEQNKRIKGDEVLTFKCRNKKAKLIKL